MILVDKLAFLLNKELFLLRLLCYATFGLQQMWVRGTSFGSHNCLNKTVLAAKGSPLTSNLEGSFQSNNDKTEEVPDIRVLIDVYKIIIHSVRRTV